MSRILETLPGMEMTVRDAMASAMWRYHDAALERAALIYTFARSTSEDTSAGYAIYGRQLAILIDVVHEFCFNACLAIERAEMCRPGIMAELQALDLHEGKTELVLSDLDYPKNIALSQESYWWVLGKILHSKETHVVYRTVDVVVTDRRSGQHHTINQPVAFGFSSDRDSDRIDQYVELEALAMLYVGGIASEIERAISARSIPAERHDSPSGYV